MRTSRIVANIVGMMLFVQVILGGGSVLLGFPVIYHFIWGLLSFIVLILATVFAVREYGSKSVISKVGYAAIIDFVVQIILGALALSSDVMVVVHLTNAFVLGVVVTYLIMYADTMDKSGMAAAAAVKVP